MGRSFYLDMKPDYWSRPCYGDDKNKTRKVLSSWGDYPGRMLEIKTLYSYQAQKSNKLALYFS